VLLFREESPIVLLVCRFCIAAYGLHDLPEVAWPNDFAQWPVFISSHRHRAKEIKQLSNRVSLPVGLVKQWTQEAVPLQTPSELNPQEEE
jgi:hypothetical protein